MLLAGIEEGEFEDVKLSSFHFLQNGSGISLKIDEGGRIKQSWILLDNQSTVDVFQNRALLSNVRQVKGFMDIHCNAGVASTNWVGDLPGYGTVWYHQEGIANILSLAKVKEKYRVMFDSSGENAFVVHKEDGTTRVFQESERGLYYMDTAATGTLLVSTVDDNKSNYTTRDYS